MQALRGARARIGPRRRVGTVQPGRGALMGPKAPRWPTCLGPLTKYSSHPSHTIKTNMRVLLVVTWLQHVHSARAVTQLETVRPESDISTAYMYTLDLRMSCAVGDQRTYAQPSGPHRGACEERCSTRDTGHEQPKTVLLRVVIYFLAHMTSRRHTRLHSTLFTALFVL